MSKKVNKKSNKVVREMRECFQDLHLPVNKNNIDKDFNIVFTSEICNDHVCAVVAATYDRQLEYVAIEIHFQPKVPADKLVETWRLLNLLNRMMPLYHYCFCACCNSISLEGALLLPGGNLDVSKFKCLIHEMLDDSYLCMPLIEAVMQGGNPDVLYEEFMKDYSGMIDSGGCSSKEIKHRILGNVETVLADLNIKIEAENKSKGCFVNFLCSEAADFHLRMGIKVIAEGRMITLHLAPSFTVPDEKIPLMTELIGRINKMSIHNHLFIQQDPKRISLIKGIIIIDGVLDKKEFKLILDSILACGRMVFPMIKEQLSSNESPAAVVERLLGTATCNE